MNNILKTLIDYSLFEKYDKDYFINNKILPLSENDISIKMVVCKSSKLETIKNDFNKVISFIEIEELELLFMISHIEKKTLLYSLALKAISQNSFEKYIDKFLQELLSFSINLRASDIHLEQYKDVILFKFRIDGRLKTFFAFNCEFFKLISSYIKLISNLDMTQIRLPQDGRFALNIEDKKYDFRVSTMPTLEAESIVLRILDNKNINKNLQTLGISLNLFELLSQALKLTQGLILISGPTGSGKTTTLYSILQELNCEEKKIITVEDPIEYKIDSICQIPINSKIGLSFELVLKNILRQDPDIIFIGEIRDKFSLDIALQASLTGHLVIASIHANNAVETILRLIDLQADPFLISSTLKLVMAQRLVLNYCTFCDSQGCQKCNYTKYYDRTIIAEILKIDEIISSMIFKKSDINELKDYLEKINFKTIIDDGKQKVEQKQTSLEEVYKVASF
ncbi:MAG: GspE/PulE family protein [Campylobacterales bacterium]|nr:GspE/PulE family protein [Campylobacterales bacterium]